MRKSSRKGAIVCGRKGLQKTALFMAAALTVSCVPVAAAQISNGVVPTYDEAYYGTLDYYGNLTDGSVVKSYSLNGASAVTDYGNYDQIINLTDSVQPATTDGKNVFRFNQGDMPDHFYFEGKTAKPFESLPWTVSMTYKLNGVAAKAEDLAGKTGMVEIDLNLMPNQNASEYARDNYILTATTLFNQDDILSLKAEGAQVQLIGNLRLVMFMALPGEEEHYVIEVGANDFSFDGMTFLMVPATLSQLDQIAELGERKDELQDDYDKLSGSLDTLLDSMGNMSSSLYATADGLDELDSARGTISAGKGEVYGNADKALGDLDGLSKSLSTLPGHLDTASQAVTDVTKDLTQVTKTAVGLKTDLGDVQDSLSDIQTELNKIHSALTSGDGSLKTHLSKLGTDVNRLQADIATLRSTIPALETQLSGGMTSEEISGAVAKEKTLDAVYQKAGGDLSEETFENVAIQYGGQDPASVRQLISGGDTAVGGIMAATGCTEAEALSALEANPTAYGMTAELVSQYVRAKQEMGLLDQIYGATTSDHSMDETQFMTAMLMLNAINSGSDAGTVIGQESTYETQAKQLMQLAAIYGSVSASDGLLSDMGTLCDVLGSNGISDDLSELTGYAGNTLDNLNDLENTAYSILSQTETLLSQIQTLDSTVNSYVPELKTTLSDTKDLIGSLNSTVGDTHGFLSSFESLLKKSGTQLDAGTKKTLEGLASSLRGVAKSASKTGDVKSAKDSISSIIEKTWNEHSGDMDNLLNMDSTAVAVSMTSAENLAPESIQVLLRTQEIKVDDKTKPTQEQTQSNNGTFFSRVGRMFGDFWHAVTGIFH